MQIRPFQPNDEDAVVQLWIDCELTRPWNNPHEDIARKQKIQPELFLIGIENNRLVASVMAGYDGHRGWLYYLAVSPEHRNRGYGRKITEAVEAKLIEMGCPKVNLQLRKTNEAVAKFYDRSGYKKDEVIGYGKRLITDQK